MAPSKLVRRYSVMGWFKVTYCWPEKDTKSGKLRYKFRFELLDTKEHGWWAAADSPGVSKGYAIEEHICPSCNNISPYIYDDEWMCLRSECKGFWKVSVVCGLGKLRT